MSLTVGALVVVVAVVVIAVVIVQRGQAKRAEQAREARAKATAAAARSRLLTRDSSAPAPNSLLRGRSAVRPPCPARKGTGPWELSQPKVQKHAKIGHTSVDFCGMWDDGNSSSQEDNSGAELYFRYPGGFGSYSNTVAIDLVRAPYQGESWRNTYLGIDVSGFNGNFTDLEGAMGAEEQSVGNEGERFYKVPPGPHGGEMRCGRYAVEKLKIYEDDCVYATHTTLGAISMSTGDALNKHPGFLKGISPYATALEIRNTLEYPKQK